MVSMFENLTMYQALKEACLDYPKGTAIFYEGNKISFGKLLSLVDYTSAILYNELGIRKDDVILLSQPNIPNVIILFYALNKIGAVANMVHPFTPFDQLLDIYHKTNCKLAFVFEQRVAKEVDKFKDIVNSIYITRIEDFLPPLKKASYHIFMNNKIRKKLLDYADFKYFYKLKTKNYSIEENMDCSKLSVLLHSGSTTGEPKIICHNDKAFNFIASHACEFLDCTSEFIKGKGMLSVLPSFHGFGLCMGMHSPIVNRFASVLIPKFTVKKVCKAFNHFDIATSIGVPTMYQTLIDSDLFLKNKHVKNLHVAFAGGDTLPKRLQSDFNMILKLKGSRCQLFEGYGLTEVIAVNCVNTFKDNKVYSLGKPASDVKFKFIDDNGNEVEPNVIGEICIMSGSCMLGYYNDEAATNSCLKDGWLHTGDLGYVDTDGFIHFSQRKKRVIKVSGVAVFPSEIESFIMQNFPQIKEICAIEVPDEKLGHAIKIIVSPVLNDSLLDEIREKCSSYLIRWAVPKEISFMSELPRTLYGKINFTKLQNDENVLRGVLHE